MDVLKNKRFQNYDYVCRYSSVPYYYNTKDEKWIYGIGEQINKNIPYLEHKVVDSDTLDYLALKYYNNPTYYWVIAYFNNIQDCYCKLSDFYKVLKIPNISSISFSGE